MKTKLIVCELCACPFSEEKRNQECEWSTHLPHSWKRFDDDEDTRHWINEIYHKHHGGVKA